MSHQVEEIDKLKIAELKIGEVKIHRLSGYEKIIIHLEKFRHKLRHFKHDLHHLNNEVQGLQKEVHHLQHEVRGLQHEVHELRHEVHELRLVVQSQQVQIQSLQTQLQQLQLAVETGIVPNPALQSLFQQLTGQMVTIATPGGNVTGTVVEAGDDAVVIRESTADLVIIPYSKISGILQGGM